MSEKADAAMDDTGQNEQGQDDQGQNEQGLESFVPYQLSIASNAVSSVIAGRYRKRFALKIPEWRVIAVLGDARERGGRQTQRELTEMTLMDKVAVNRACKVLEERGLVNRIANERDGRSHLLELSDEGQGIYREVMPVARAIEQDLFAGFTSDEQQMLRAMLGRVRERAGEMLKSAD